MEQDNLTLDKQDTKQKQGPFESIGAKLIVSFSLLFVAVLTITELAGIKGIPFTSYPGRQEQQRSETFEGLELIADLKKERLLRWIEEKRADIYVTFSNEMAQVHIDSLHATLHEFINKGKEGTELWTLIREEKGYKKLVDFLQIVKSAYGAYDKIYVADAETGITFLSTDDMDLGTNVSPYAFFAGALRDDAIYVSDIAIDPQSQRPALHISTPIKDSRGKTIALLIMEINADDIIKPMLHTGEGLGERGEALLVNQDVKILTSLKHPLADGTIAKPLEYQIQAQPAILAAQGDEGIIETKDYRGEPVLAAYRHIRISSDRGWGLVVKQDQAELYAPLQQDTTLSLLAGMVGTLAGIGLTIIIARGLTQPIRSLGQAANRITAGDLDARAPVTTSDEVGMLATTFNAMVQRIQNWHVELEEQVQTRTVELNKANKELMLEITERQIAQEALQESESRLWAILDHSPALISIKDLQGNVTLANRKFEVLDGPSPEEFVGKNVYDLFPFDIADALWKNDLAALDAGGPVEAEETVTHKDGTRHTYLTVKFPLYGKADQALGICAISTDITERIKIEDELRKSEEQYRTLIETMNDGLIVLDAETSITYANDRYCKMMGYSRDELVGQPINDAFDEANRHILKEQLAQRRKGGHTPYEITYTRKDGDDVHTITSPQPMFDTEGNFQGSFAVVTDITERKRAEVALRESEKQYRNLISHLDAGVVVHAPDTHIILSNAASNQILGLTKDQMQGKTAIDPTWNFLREDGTVMPLDEYPVNLVVSTGQPLQQYVVGITKPGCADTAWVLVNAFPMFSGQNELQQIVVTFMDVSERVRTEKALRKSQEQYQILFDSMLDGYAIHEIICDDKGNPVDYRFLDINPAFKKLTGLGRDIINKTVLEALPMTEQYWIDTYGKVALTGESIGFENYSKELEKWFEVIAFSPVEKQFVTVFRDVTERKQAEDALRESEEKFRHTIEGISDGFFTLDDNLVITYFNQVAEELLGRSSKDVLKKHIFDQAFPQAKGSVFDEKYTWAVDNEKPVSFETYFGEKPYENWYDVRVYPQANGISVYFQVITERKHHAEEREAMIQELEAKNAELEQFTYTVSHDLKSPLITIKGFLGLLEQDALAGDTERVKADIARISNATDKMQQLLEELLELSRIGRLVNPPEKVELGALVREAADLVSGRLVERGVHLEIAPNLPMIYGDRPRIRSVLENLIDNAVKFMGEQSEPRIEIKVRYDDKETVVYVRDNGIGINPRYHDKVFGLFEKLDQQTEGTGVGLAIVKRIIEVHGGRIWVESEGIGHGSTFCFTLSKKGT